MNKMQEKKKNRVKFTSLLNNNEFCLALLYILNIRFLLQYFISKHHYRLFVLLYTFFFAFIKFLTYTILYLIVLEFETKKKVLEEVFSIYLLITMKRNVLVS